MTAIQKSDETPTARRRKEQVLAAAADCFRREGFHGSSMAQISAAAGMSSGHIYHYFGSKEGIVAAIVERERSELGLLFEEVKAATQQVDVASAIVDKLPVGIARNTDNCHVSLLMDILAEASRNSEIAQVIQRSDRELREEVYQFIGGDTPEAKSRYEILGALLEGLSIRVLRNPDLDAVLDQEMLRRVVRYVLTPPTDTAP
ncbi:TetR/AcrR family transcriptional regulator [Xanthomonas hortorum pv. hederae]|nr:TetR/AcrR family transcriptional regulator [Xanthomonas hortorum pv. hederae]PPU86157.1 TetR family transcriptional regulator [Xanthomonas hortorum pv. hederae]PUF01221.1 TetR/AcrR family transcriptional regulator [Xanthomonas hortorum pv. hederae]